MGQYVGLNTALHVREGGEIDVTDAGQMTARFLRNLLRDLSLSYVPDHWTEAKLAAWFWRQIHDASITHDGKCAFVAFWLAALLAKDRIDLARVNRQKFLLRNLSAQERWLAN